MTDLFISKEKNSTPSTAVSEQHITHPHIFYSFWQNPTEISFEDQEEGEKILLLLRRHFFSNLSWILISFIAAFVPIVFAFFSSNFPLLNIVSLPPGFWIIFVIFYYLLIFTYAFVNFITWYFNISLITDRRIIDVNFSGLVYKNVSATKLSLIQDASYTQVGVVRSLFDYGDVLLQTAGTVDNFVFEVSPKPEKVVQIVESLIGTERRSVSSPA